MPAADEVSETRQENVSQELHGGNQPRRFDQPRRKSGRAGDRAGRHRPARPYQPDTNTLNRAAAPSPPQTIVADSAVRVGHASYSTALLLVLGDPDLRLAGRVVAGHVLSRVVERVDATIPTIRALGAEFSTCVSSAYIEYQRGSPYCAPPWAI